ncbi:hypothetical protein BDQ17DRAFT_684918 [Cyathus striatus]|nr:hypothetical protein BDQ17DRAFT_684918 [Cyathus striatus]
MAKKKLLDAFTEGLNGEKILEVPLSISAWEENLKEDRTEEKELILKYTRAVPAFVIETRMAFFSLDREVAETLIFGIDTISLCAIDDSIRGCLKVLDAMNIDEWCHLKKFPGTPNAIEVFFSLDRNVAENIFDRVFDKEWGSEAQLRFQLVNLGVVKKGRACNFTDYPEGYTGKKMRKDAASLSTLQNRRIPDGKVALWLAGMLEQDAGTPTPKRAPRKKQRKATPKIASVCVGRFSVVVCDATEDWPWKSNFENMIEFEPSSTGSHIWGFFRIGVVYGYIRSVGPLPSRAGTSMNFLWRGNVDVDEMSFGEYNKGTIIFSGNGTIDGTISIKGENNTVVEAIISGHLDMRPQREWGDKATHWKREWRLLNHVAEEREWSSDVDRVVDVELPADSDTTDDEAYEGHN